MARLAPVLGGSCRGLASVRVAVAVDAARGRELQGHPRRRCRRGSGASRHGRCALVALVAGYGEVCAAQGKGGPRVLLRPEAGRTKAVERVAALATARLRARGECSRVQIRMAVAAALVLDPHREPRLVARVAGDAAVPPGERVAGAVVVDARRLHLLPARARVAGRAAGAEARPCARPRGSSRTRARSPPGTRGSSRRSPSGRAGAGRGSAHRRRRRGGRSAAMRSSRGRSPGPASRPARCGSSCRRDRRTARGARRDGRRSSRSPLPGTSGSCDIPSRRAACASPPGGGR